MTIRAVVTVALAAALVAASLPVVERARVQHSDARIAGEVERLETVARSLVHDNDLVSDDGPPARARVTLHLPIRSWGSSGVSEFRIRPPSEPGDVVWTVPGGERRYRQLSDVRVGGPSGGLVLRDGGRQRLMLELRRLDGRRTVIVRRLPNDPDGAG